MVKDARFPLFFCIFSAALAWQLNLFALLCLLPFLLAYYAVKTQKKSRKPLFSLMIFVFIWAFFIFLIKSAPWLQGISLIQVQENALFALAFALRLLAAGCIGLLIPLTISYKDFACAITWVASFFTKKNSWKIGLLSLLVLSIIPLFFKIAQELRQNIQYRFQGTKVHVFTQVKLFAINFIKSIALQNNALAVAILARGLYSPAAFQKKWPPLSLKQIQVYKWEFLLTLFIVFLFTLKYTFFFTC